MSKKQIYRIDQFYTGSAFRVKTWIIIDNDVLIENQESYYRTLRSNYFVTL